MSSENPIHLLIADDHAIVLEGMKAIISSDPSCKVIAKALNGQQVIDFFKEYNPDITILDLVMPEIDGIQALQEILQINPHAKIIILSAHDDEERIYQAIQAGAKTYIHKEVLVDELVKTIKAVHLGQQTMSGKIAARYIARTTKPELSERELEILQFIARGKTNGEIAAHLTITEGTVKVHVHNILGKLGVNDRTSAVIEAIKRGLIRL